MSNAPLMPKATAVWLVDNTALTFDQVADFTKMHPLEVRAIADGDAAQGIKGMDPISTGQLSRDEIEKGEKDPNYRLKLGESKVALPPAAKKKGPRYTPVSRRHERPSAILWLVRNHPELKDAQIMRLVGTTKTTIASERLDPDPDGPGDARPVLADRARFRGAARRQGEAGRYRLRRRDPAAGLRDHPQGAGIRAHREAARRSQCRCGICKTEDDWREEGGAGVRRGGSGAVGAPCRPNNGRHPRACGDPVRRGLSAPSQLLWNTGSPAFAGDDGSSVGATASRSRRAIRASFAGNIPPSSIRGRRECRAPDAPDSRVCNDSGRTHTR